MTMTNSSGVHSVEVGNFNMTNLMPNSPYKVSDQLLNIVKEILLISLG